MSRARYRYGYRYQSGQNLSVDTVSYGYNFTTDGSDAVGVQDLTEVNSPTFGASGVDLEADSSQYLTRPSNPVLQTGNIDWSMSLFWTPESTTNGTILTAKADQSTNIEWFLRYDVADFISSAIRNGVQTEVATAYKGSMSTGSTYHIVVITDVATQSHRMYVDTVLSIDDTTWVGLPGVNSTAFTVGARSFGDLNVDGIIKYLFFWRGYLLTASDITYLYNGGAGRAYPFS